MWWLKISKSIFGVAWIRVSKWEGISRFRSKLKCTKSEPQAEVLTKIGNNSRSQHQLLEDTLYSLNSYRPKWKSKQSKVRQWEQSREHAHGGKREIETSVINIWLGCLLMGLYSVLCYATRITTKNEFSYLRIFWVRRHPQGSSSPTWVNNPQGSGPTALVLAPCSHQVQN